MFPIYCLPRAGNEEAMVGTVPKVLGHCHLLPEILPASVLMHDLGISAD